MMQKDDKKVSIVPTIQNVGWTVGSYCNAKCAHCYSQEDRKQNQILTIHEIDIILDKIARAGAKTINLGGNEPLFTNGADPTVSNLPYLIQQAVQKKLKIGITTNGTTAAYLSAHRSEILQFVNDWDFSLDSPIKAEHDKNRGSGSFEQVTKTLHHFATLGIPRSIVMCAMNWNTTRDHARRLVKLARDCESEIRINLLKPVDPLHHALLPTRDQTFLFFEELGQLTDQLYFSEPIFAGLTGNKSSECPCGKSSMSIHPKTADGRVPISPCVFLRDYKVYDLLQDDISYLIDSVPFQKLRLRHQQPPVACQEVECEYIAICRGGCAARTYLIVGSINAPDPMCPKMSPEVRKIVAPSSARTSVKDNFMRVHEGYLCTWIGKPMDVPVS